MNDNRGWRGQSYGMPDDPRPNSPIPDLRVLQWVAPIAASERRGSVEVTILSLEAYDDGFVLNVRMAYDNPATLGTPELVLTITDDRGTEYHARRPGGFGGGGPTQVHWRAAYFFAPALGKDARQLRIEAPEFQWMAHDDATRRLIVAETHPGPWAFSADLSTLPRLPAH